MTERLVSSLGEPRREGRGNGGEEGGDAPRGSKLLVVRAHDKRADEGPGPVDTLLLRRDQGQRRTEQPSHGDGAERAGRTQSETGCARCAPSRDCLTRSTVQQEASYASDEQVDEGEPGRAVRAAFPPRTTPPLGHEPCDCYSDRDTSHSRLTTSDEPTQTRQSPPLPRVRPRPTSDRASSSPRLGEHAHSQGQ